MEIKLPVLVKYLKHPAPSTCNFVSLTDVVGSDCEESNNRAADSENVRVLINFSYYFLISALNKTE